jgi:hypothetical protein
LCVLENLRTEFSTRLKDHLASSGGQIRGATKEKVRLVLERFGIDREFVGEGARTNRGNVEHVNALLAAIEEDGWGAMSVEDRHKQIDVAQAFLAECVRTHFDRDQITFDFESSNALHAVIGAILSAADVRGQRGSVAQHLVGAKLQNRYPARSIENRPVASQDASTGRQGDFQIEATVLHVTVAPSDSLCLKCKNNLKDLLHVFVLVPDDSLAAAQQLLRNHGLAEKVLVASIESYVGSNVMELAEFADPALRREFARLLRTYNERVEQVENDRSLQIRMPEGLEH